MDATRLWATVRQHRRRLALILPALLIFAAGWQAGRVTSPYYATQPIIFEDNSTPANSNGNIQELRDLQAAGQQGRGEVAGAAQPEPSNPLPPGDSPESSSAPSAKRFVGSVNSDLYHDPSCAAASRINKENQIWFESMAEAEATGYRPSKCTEDLLPP